MDPQLVLLTLAVVVVGFGSGVLSGMFGVGGAVLTTPGIRALGATPLAAIGSTVPPIIPGAISGAYRYARAGLVDWRVGVACGIAGAVAAVAGARVSDAVDPHLLMVATAGLLAISAISTWRGARGPRPDPVALEALADEAPPIEVGSGATPPVSPLGFGAGPAARPVTGPPTEPRPLALGGAPTIARPVGAPPIAGGRGARDRAPLALLVAVGAAAGALAGVLGVGGGIVLMPAFTALLRLPVRVAAASSLVAVAIFSVPAVAAHALLGHINWFYAGWLAVGAIPGAHLGARITMRVDERLMARAFAGFLLLLAVGMGLSELAARG